MDLVIVQSSRIRGKERRGQADDELIPSVAVVEGNFFPLHQLDVLLLPQEFCLIKEKYFKRDLKVPR